MKQDRRHIALDLYRRATARNVKIPRNIAAGLCQDKEVLHLVAVYLQLKAVFYTGDIREHKSKSEGIAAFLNISRRTWLDRKKELIICGLAQENGKDLQLASYKEFENYLSNFFEIPKSQRYYKFKIDAQNLAGILHEKYPVKHLIRLIAIEENKKKQLYKVKEKIRIQEFATLENINGNSYEIADKTKLRFDQIVNAPQNVKRKQMKVLFGSEALENFTLAKYDHIFYKQTANNLEATINTRITLSGSGVAKLFNLGSKSAAAYWLKKYEDAELLKVERMAAIRISPKRKRLEPKGKTPIEYDKLNVKENARMDQAKQGVNNVKSHAFFEGNSSVFNNDTRHNNKAYCVTYRKFSNILTAQIF